MKTKNILKALVLAGGLTAGTAALGSGGDIYDICPWSGTGAGAVRHDAWATFDNPLTSGETVYFNVRLVQRTIGDANTTWYLDYVGLGSEELNMAMYPLQIGIYVSGKLQYADLVDCQPNEDKGVTDLIFAYKTSAGEFALPVILATGTSEADATPSTDEDSAITYLLNRYAGNGTGKWKITNGAGQDCNMYYWSFAGVVSVTRSDPLDFSLAASGIYVKTVDFDSDWASSEIWRSVYMNSTTIKSPSADKRPTIKTTAPAADKVTMYVWSDDETAVRINGGVEKTVETVDGVEIKRQVGTLTIAGGSSSANFEIFGVTSNKTANLVLSPWPYYRYSQYNGNRVGDFVTAKVLCAEPQEPTVTITTADKTIYADGDYLNPKTHIAVSLTQASPVDVTVTLKTSFEADDTMTNWSDYLRFTTTPPPSGGLETLPAATEPTVTIPAGSTEVQHIYVYALRGDSNTVGTGHQIKFTPDVPADVLAAAGIDPASLTAGALYISAANPVITSPEPNTSYNVTAGESMEIAIAVSDTYADMTDTATGYTVSVKLTGSSSWKDLDEKFKASGENGELVGMTSGNAPKVSYGSSGEFVTQVRVTAPISGKKSEFVPINVTVTPAKSTSIAVYDEATGEYKPGIAVCNEGENVMFQVSLSEQNDTGTELYAFLVPNGTIDVTMFGGTAAKAIVTDETAAAPETTGLPISKTGTAVTSSFIVLDGASKADGGKNYSFKVALCTTQSYNPSATTRLEGYDTTDYLTLLVYNVEPVFEKVYLEGFDAESDGYHFSNQYPKGQVLQIQPEFDDVSYDLLHGFEYKWTASCDGQAKANGVVKMDKTATAVTTTQSGTTYTTVVPEDGTHSINDYPFTYNYPRAGTWTVKIQMKDKDMTKYSTVTYTISFNVINNPQVMIETEESYAETDAKAKIPVTLGYFESDESLVVKLTVTPPDGVNPGLLVLDDQYKTVPVGYAPLADNEYYITFTQAETINVGVKTMDGTDLSSSRGFTVEGEVVSTGISTDPTLTWAQYYSHYITKVRIENVKPVFGSITEENTSTNAWEVAGGAATSYPIRWAIRSDVSPDFTTTWANGTGPGIKVSIAGCENEKEFFVGETGDWSGTFIPDFGTRQGPQRVTLTIEDKDGGGYQTWNYHYYVTPSKFIETVAHGPAGVMGNSTYSVYYGSAKGLGKGHVYPNGATFSNARLFHLNWNVSSAASSTIFGFGYKLDNPIDDGNLDDGLDQAIDPNGNTWTTGDYYTYTSEENLDSYLYAWIYSLPAKETGTYDWRRTIVPETPKGGKDSLTVLLPSSTTEDGNYIPVVVEGVFSRELYPEDNIGDINGDGIPDVFAVKQWGGGSMIETGDNAEEVTKTDLKSLASYNDDGDRLPGAYNGQMNYAPVGPEFNALFEIRGFHAGLNATDVTTSEISFSNDEQLAWEAYAAAKGLDPVADRNLANWSPEPKGDSVRMDPTLADTDSDGFPDGWEYYFWYAAHVWKPINHDRAQPQPGQQFFFERFNTDIADPNCYFSGTEIEADEVEARFNPVQRLSPDTYNKNPDFDNDGLTDLEELVIGTNPCHWDTDGDHMSDGWEVMMSLNPLSQDNYLNEDGDFMAYYTFTMYYEDETGTRYVLPTLVEGVDYDAATLEILEDLEDCPCFTFVPSDLTYGTTEGLFQYVTERADPLIWGMPMVKDIERGTISIPAGTILAQGTEYLLIHDQVRTALGYDPRTAWFRTANGFVADRWDPTMSSDTVQSDGEAVNTCAYTAYDEYLVMMYRLQYNIVYTSEGQGVPRDSWALFQAKTTNPTVTAAAADNDDDAEGDGDGEEEEDTNTARYKASQALANALAAAGTGKRPLSAHGADTDSDGVPDGWELYTYNNPNGAISNADRDGDGDGLEYPLEYAGVDSCNAYRGCATIYANHPGNRSGWWNKFFPTDPVNSDTDGDGIPDGDEGSVWSGQFFRSGKTYDLTDASNYFTFIYGATEDNGTTCCIRGGGMNPCAVDTDLDGLPDLWEKANAGIVAYGNTRSVLPPTVGADIDETWFYQDKIFDDNQCAQEDATYIYGGMDATWPGDYISPAADSVLADLNNQPRLRDVDFDHDGLENFQEYLIQSVRHFRYDDITTPLMGRILTEGEYAGTELLGPHSQQFMGYVVHDCYSPETLKESAVAAWDTDEATVEAHTDRDDGLYQFKWNDDGWRSLGYFAPPMHYWDRSLTSGMFADARYMMAVKPSEDSEDGAYVTTDPRKSDSDGDGMDDFYEMYHGLNPILGSDANAPGDARDIIAAAYGKSGTFNAYCNEWIFPDFNRAAALEGQAAGGPIDAPRCYDPVLYPWIMGTALADADGDGIRNDEERLLANTADPAPTHTDPTPLWFTERTTPMSYVNQYYPVTQSVRAMLLLPSDPQPQFVSSFEEGEGFDTDNDFVPDSREVVRTTTLSTDPLVFSDPARRQALYLDGENSFAMTRDMQLRPDAYDLLKQFTVECWVRPERDNAAQTIVERSAFYPGSALTADEGAVRANFRIGLDNAGNIYGMFDNNDAKESGLDSPVSCQFVTGRHLDLEKWHHVALTFNGTNLTLYVNGALEATAHTKLIPANGVTGIIQETSSTESFEMMDFSADALATFIGARPVKGSEIALTPIGPEAVASKEEAFAQYREFFKGYVDEVRIWDGARSAVEIHDDYMTRYDFAKAAKNRDEVYESWFYDEATRNSNDGKENLPPELIAHYSFQTLPGAVNPENAAKTLAGYDSHVKDAAFNSYEDFDTDGLYVNTADLAALRGTEDALNVFWWQSTHTRSEVYTDYRRVPWIQNTVQHLPLADGAVTDSHMYSEMLGSGYVPAHLHDIDSFVFPNTGIPECSAYHYNDPSLRAAKSAAAAEVFGGQYSDVDGRCQYMAKITFEGTSDLVPMGGAFAKTCPEMWDGHVADAWEYSTAAGYTGDEDGDGLPDWWTDYVRNNGSASGVDILDLDPETGELLWNTEVEYRGLRMPAWQAYSIQLALGLQPDGTIDPAYRATVDADGNGLPDWWEKVFGVQGGARGHDSDGDGLPDSAEYLLSFVFDTGTLFDPLDPTSQNENELDYFYPIGSLYAGEIFTDHDMMDDAWERLQGVSWASPYKWDATGDNDEDGWSAFAEARYNESVSAIVASMKSHILGENEMRDFPIPTLKLTLRYNGSQKLSGGGNGGNNNNANEMTQTSDSLPPIVIETFTDKQLQSKNVVPDAKFVIESGSEHEYYAFIGQYSENERSGVLTPGNVNVMSIDFEYAYLPTSEEILWSFTDPTTGETEYYRTTFEAYQSYRARYGSDAVQMFAGDGTWNSFIGNGSIVATQPQDGSEGVIMVMGEPVGTLNAKTGEYKINLKPFGAWIGSSTNDTGNVALEDCIFRIKYSATLPVTGANKVDVCLGAATAGYVREGKNHIVAFYDLDGSGEYTPGEPFGYAESVDVGWSQGKAEIELTDTSPVFTRALITSQGGGDGGSVNISSDRHVLYGSEDGDYYDVITGDLSGGPYQRVRVLRTLVNGYSISELGIANRLIYDRLMELDQRPYIFEGDILSDTEFDIDWSTFKSEIGDKVSMNVTSVTYRIVLGNGPTATDATNNLLSLAVVRHFDTVRHIPEAVSPGDSDSVLYGSRPTFKWSMNGLNSYTAFQLQIMSDGALVWDSQVRHAPARDSNGYYTFVPDVYVGDKLKSDKKYTWRVSMMNAKYNTPKWSDTRSFYVATSNQNGEHGTINVCAKYYGPSLGQGKIRVEAFENPDFSGDPVARATVTDTANVRKFKASHTANAKLVGLPEGTYYIRAYLDADDYGTERKRDSFEPWGYACPRSLSPDIQYKPSAVRIGSDITTPQVITVHIEDVDANANSVPDLYEMAHPGTAADTTLDGGMAVSSAIVGMSKLENATSGTTGLQARLAAALSQSSVAALVLGVDESKTTLAQAVADATEVVDGTLTITALALDSANGTVTLTVDAEVENSYANTDAALFYEFPKNSTVNVVVWKKDSLGDSDWTKVAVKTVTLGTESQDVTVALPDGTDLAGGFFRVTVE